MSSSPASVSRGDLAPTVGLLLLGSLAFVHLMAVPAFEDEGSQLRWIFRLIQCAEWLPPLGGGKPLEAWLIAPFAALGMPALASARVMHVLAGMLGAVLTYRLARQFEDRRIAFASGFLFAICPFVVYLQRFALSDMFLCTAGIWVLSSVMDLLRLPTRRRAGMLAAALVAAAFCKFPVGFVFLGALPLALCLMPTEERRGLLHRRAPLLAYAHLPVGLLALTVAAVATVRLRQGETPGFGLDDFAGIALGRYHDIAATIGMPRSTLWQELSAQLSSAVIVIAAIGLIAAARLGDWRHRWLIAAGIIPMLGIAFLAGFWYSRYLLFTLPPLIVSAVHGWDTLARRLPRAGRAVQWSVLAICTGLMGRQSALLVFAPADAHWSPLDRFQYLEGWTSGYGYPEAARFLMNAPQAPRRIYSLDGHSAYQLLTYLPRDWEDRVAPVLYADSGRAMRGDETRLAQFLEHLPAWVIAPEPLLKTELESSFGESSAARLVIQPIARFDKPGLRSALALYEITRR